MKNKLMKVLLTLVTVFAMTTAAYAANTITFKSDKPLMPDSTCGEAGAITLQFDDNTIIHEGDVIRFALSNGVTVCGNLDYYMVLADDGIETLSDTNSPVSSTNESATITVTIGADTHTNGSDILDDTSQWDVGFRVQASDNSRYITLTLGRRVIETTNEDNFRFTTEYANTSRDMSIKFTCVDDEQAIVKLFHGLLAYNFAELSEKTVPAGVDTAEVYWEKTAGATIPLIYDNNELNDLKDNTLCVDTATNDYAGDYVYAIPTSEPFGGDSTYQQTFLGDYIVAQLIAQMEYVVEPSCKDDICNYIPTVGGVNQDNEEVPADGNFDFGTYSTSSADSTSIVDRWSSTGYCSSVGNTIGNGLKFYLSGDTFQENDQFRFTFTIRVGSSEDSDMVVWDAAAPSQALLTAYNSSSNCDSDADPLNTTLRAADMSNGAWGVWGGDDNTEMTAFRGTVTIQADETTFGAVLFDLPSATIDLDNASAGQKVYVDVVVEKLPCGTIVNETICLGELIADCPATAGSAKIDGIAFIGDRALTNVLHGYLGRVAANNPSTTLGFPYAPSLDDADFFTGIAITNIGGAAGTVTFTLTDAAGGTATWDGGSLAAGNQLVTTLDAIKDSLVNGTTALDTTKTVYISVKID
jgi:hypothetical protein